MICPHCGSTVPALDGRCGGCGASLGSESSLASSVTRPVPTSAADDKRTWPSTLQPEASPTWFPELAPTGQPPRGSPPSGSGPLGIGQNFGSRYHIIRLLGIGGMGAVYQTWDRALEVAVALKVIRPEAMADPA